VRADRGRSGRSDDRGRQPAPRNVAITIDARTVEGRISKTFVRQFMEFMYEDH
jgi:hypothetical protein